MGKKKKTPFLKTFAGIFDLSIMYIITLLFIVGPITILTISGGNLNQLSTFSITLSICLLCLSLVITFLYIWLSLWTNKGSTLGMKVFQLQYINEDGAPIKWTKYLVYALVYEFLFIITFGVAILIDIIVCLIRKSSYGFIDHCLKFKTVRVLAKEEE